MADSGLDRLAVFPFRRAVTCKTLVATAHSEWLLNNIVQFS